MNIELDEDNWQQHFAELPVLSEEYDSGNSQHLLQWLISRQICDEAVEMAMDNRFIICRGMEISHLTPLNATVKASGSETTSTERVCSRVVAYISEHALSAVALSHHSLLSDLASYRVVFRQPLSTDSFSRTLADYISNFHVEPMAPYLGRTFNCH